MDESVFGLADWIVEHCGRNDRAEAELLIRLAEFDRSGDWALDGQVCCANWLSWKTRMARSTAFDKLRVGHALLARPIIAEAMTGGRLSYSAVRAITRMEDAEPEVDQKMVELATTPGVTIHDIEKVVRSYILHREQDLGPNPLDWRREVRIRRDGNGLGQIRITATELEIEEFEATLRAFVDPYFNGRRDGPESSREDSGAKAGDESSREDAGPATGVGAGDESSREDAGPATGVGAGDESSREDAGSGTGAGARPGDESSREDAGIGGEPGDGSRAARRVDAFMDMVATGLAGADGGGAAGDDRYLVHLVKVSGSEAATTLDGSPLGPGDSAVACCDSSTVTHDVGADHEQLNLGRKTRAWSTPQRRAVAVRDGGHCRFPGCTSRFVDIHHLQWWEQDGPTDVANGMSACRRHHTMLHKYGYRVEGHPNAELEFFRPDGTPIDCTYPVHWAQLHTA